VVQEKGESCLVCIPGPATKEGSELPRTFFAIGIDHEAEGKRGQQRASRVTHLPTVVSTQAPILDVANVKMAQLR
jgi:hypothetical protein